MARCRPALAVEWCHPDWCRLCRDGLPDRHGPGGTYNWNATGGSGQWASGVAAISATPSIAPPQWVTTAATNGSGTTPAYTVPSGVAANDIILCILVIGTISAVVVTPPDGSWTEKGSALINVANGATQTRIFWKRATGADTGTYTFGLDSSQTTLADIMRYSGCVSTGDPIEAVDAEVTTAPGAVTPVTTVTTLGPNRLLVWYGYSTHGVASALTPPAAFTVAEFSGSKTKVNDTTQTAAGSSGSVQGTTSNSGGDGFNVYLLALKPPGPLGGGFFEFF